MLRAEKDFCEPVQLLLFVAPRYAPPSPRKSGREVPPRRTASRSPALWLLHEFSQLGRSRDQREGEERSCLPPCPLLVAFELSPFRPRGGHYPFRQPRAECYLSGVSDTLECDLPAVPLFCSLLPAPCLIRQALQL